MSVQAQSVLTPQQQLEEAQKKLEEAKKAVEEAKQRAEAAKQKAAAEAAKKKAEEEAKRKAAEEAKAKAEKIQQQIKEAEAETARLKAEAARLNAEANGAAATTAAPEATTAPSAPAATTATPAPATTASQGSGWVIPTATKKETPKPAAQVNGAKLKEDPKYLEGAITFDEQGKIVFDTEIEAPGKSAAQLYDLVFDYMSGLTQDKKSKASRMALVNKDECKYNLIAKITDGKVSLSINHINYIYEEGRQTGFKLPAEEVIIDKVALTKKKNDLARIFGKFRKKTIDRKDQIFNEIAALVK